LVFRTGYAGGALSALAAALLLGAVAAPPVPTALDQPAVFAPAPRWQLSADAATWARLPRVVHGGRQPLPRWARTLAATLPQTTAAMLELEYLHRARSPLPARLRGGLRWTAAHTNGCA
jgi:hypothetical protein